MGQPVGLGQPFGGVHGDRLRVPLGDELGELVVDLVPVVERHLVPPAVAGDGPGEIVGTPDVDVRDRAGASEGGPLDPVAEVGEDEVAVGVAEPVGHRVRVAVARGVDPHVHAVVAHCARQDQVELVPPEEAHDLASATGGVDAGLGGCEGGREQQRDQGERGSGHKRLLPVQGMGGTTASASGLAGGWRTNRPRRCAPLCRLKPAFQAGEAIRRGWRQAVCGAEHRACRSGDRRSQPFCGAKRREVRGRGSAARPLRNRTRCADVAPFPNRLTGSTPPSFGRRRGPSPSSRRRAASRPSCRWRCGNGSTTAGTAARRGRLPRRRPPGTARSAFRYPRR